MVGIIKWVERIKGEISCSSPGIVRTLGGLGAGVRMRVERCRSSVSSKRLIVDIDSSLGSCGSSGGGGLSMAQGQGQVSC